MTLKIHTPNCLVGGFHIVEKLPNGLMFYPTPAFDSYEHAETYVKNKASGEQVLIVNVSGQFLKQSSYHEVHLAQTNA